MSGVLVQLQQSGAEHPKHSGDHWGFQEAQGRMLQIPRKLYEVYLLLSAAGTGWLGGIFQRTLYFSSIMLWLRQMR